MSAQGTTLASQRDTGAMVDAYVDALLGMPLTQAPAPASGEPTDHKHDALEAVDAQPIEADATIFPDPDALSSVEGAEVDAVPDADSAEATVLPADTDADADALIAPDAEAWPDDEVAFQPAPPVSVEPQPVSAPPMPQAMPAARTPLSEPVSQALAEPDEDRLIHTAPTGQRWLRVAVADDRYAVELLRVQEVVRLAPVIAVRGAVPSLLGVMNLRGRVVPVHDLGRWLRRQPVQPDDRARIVVLEYQDELVGLLVTAVTDVVTLETPQIEPPNPGLRDRIGMGIARTPGAPPTVLLDARVVFD